MNPVLYLLLTLASARSAFPLAWPGPGPTEPSEPSPGWNPKPTSSPHEKAIVQRNRLLAPRAAGDNVCGYIHGSLSSYLPPLVFLIHTDRPKTTL
jgi:hypothetical protein